MARITINKLDDPRLAVYQSLKTTNLTRRLGQFVVEGEKLVERLLASRFPVVSILATDRYEPALADAVPESVPVYVIPHGLVDQLVGFPFHRGVLACATRLPGPPLEQIARNENGPLTLVICPRLSDPENLGAIARIGDVFGVNAILAGATCPDPFSRRVLRVSMGSILKIPVIVSGRLEEHADDLVRHHAVELLAAVVDPAAVPFDRIARPRRLGLVLGEENRGIDPEWLDRCRWRITIPMRAHAGSLNVAVAAGILLQSLMRDFTSGDSRTGDYPLTRRGESGSSLPALPE
jgi:tRNA G18 (ribose-2'-O)-methylase SpoU